MTAQQQLRIGLERKCRQLAERIRKRLPSSIGFTLLLFDLGEDGNIAYASSAERAGMMEALRELVENLDRNEGPTGIVAKVKAAEGVLAFLQDRVKKLEDGELDARGLVVGSAAHARYAECLYLRDILADALQDAS